MAALAQRAKIVHQQLAHLVDGASPQVGREVVEPNLLHATGTFERSVEQLLAVGSPAVPPRNRHTGGEYDSEGLFRTSSASGGAAVRDTRLDHITITLPGASEPPSS
eukprot:7391983-Prymnesium_polylepis.2